MLKPQRAEDTEGNTVFVGAKIPPDLKALLRSLPGGDSFNIRQALRDYKLKLEGKSNDEG